MSERLKGDPRLRTNTGRILSPETRAKMSAAAKKRVMPLMTLEHRAKLSAAHKARGTKPPVCKPGFKKSPEAIAKLVAAKKLDKAKRSAACKAKWLEPEYREKMRNAFRGKPSRLEIGYMAGLDTVGEEYVFQFPVPGTRYIADFYLPARNTIVEVDGKRWHDMRGEYDARRDAAIEEQGFKVVRV